MIVVDASVVLEVLLRTSVGSGLENRLRGKRQSLHAPELIDLEVAQVLRRLSLSGTLSLGVPLLTADVRLGAAPGHRAVIEVV